MSANAAFSELPSRPMRRKLSGCFFNQDQKFFVARRPQQGRGGDSAPAEAGLRRDKRLQFPEHPFVNGGVGDDPPAFVHFRLPGFKLRFDQRDDFAFRF